MKKSKITFNLTFKKTAKFMLIAGFAVIVSGCATSLEQGDPLIPVGDETPGPGLFSGKDGVFHIVGGDKVASATKPKSAAESIDDQSLRGTSAILDEKIKALEQQQKELEELKRQVNKKLNAS